MAPNRKSSVDDVLEQSSIVRHLRELLGKNPLEAASTDDIKELRNLVDEVIPAFYDSLNTPDCVLRPIEYEVCLLTRAFFSPADICKLMGRSSSYIANLRRRILMKRFGIEGAPKELDALILSICQPQEILLGHFCWKNLVVTILLSIFAASISNKPYYYNVSLPPS